MDPGDPDEGFESDGDVIEGMDVINEDDVEEVLDLGEDDDHPEDDMVEGIGEMDLENYEDEGAAAAVPPKDDSINTFKQHTGSVFCVKLDPVDGALAVTGGEDDVAYVWNTTTGDVMFKCTGHKDSVTSAVFSHDAMYIATGDMSGLVKVWKVSSGEEIWSFEVSDLEWLLWHHLTHVLLAGTSDGATWMWKIPSGDCKTFQGHGCTCNIGRVMPDGKKACLAYEDGVIKVWDLKEEKVVRSFTGNNGHSSSVTSIDCHPDNNLIITGSTDVTAKVLSASTGKVLATFNCEEGERRENETDNSVEAVAFLPAQGVAVTGTLVGSMTLWDVAAQKQRLQCKHDAGIVRIHCDKTQSHVYSCTLDGQVYMWDARSGQVVNTWMGHTAEILDFDIAINHSIVVTASEDKTAKVFTIKQPNS